MRNKILIAFLIIVLILASSFFIPMTRDFFGYYLVSSIVLIAMLIFTLVTIFASRIKISPVWVGVIIGAIYGLLSWLLWYSLGADLLPTEIFPLGAIFSFPIISLAVLFLGGYYEVGTPLLISCLIAGFLIGAFIGYLVMLIRKKTK